MWWAQSIMPTSSVCSAPTTSGDRAGSSARTSAAVEPSGGEALLPLPLHSVVEGRDLLFGQRHCEVGEEVEAAVQPRLLLHRRVEVAVEAQALKGQGRHGAGDACAPGGVEAAEGQAGGCAADACGLDDGGRDAELGEVVGDGTAENASSDDDNFRPSGAHDATAAELMRFSSRWTTWARARMN